MRATIIAFLGLSAVALTSGCKSSSSAAAKEDMQLVPKDSQMVLMANLTRMRNTAMWRKLLDLRDSDPKSKADYDEFVQKCGLDPLKQIDSVFLAFPQGAGDAKEFAAILRGPFDENKLTQCAREQAKKDGADLAISEYGGKKIYTDTKQGQAFAVFLDGKTAAIGGKEWIKKVIDLAAGKKEAGESAKDNAELMALMKRAKISDAAWGAGLVPQAARDSLKNDPHLSSAASMKDVYGSVDFASGFVADINVDVGSEQDAKDLTAKVQSQLADTKKNPQIMMMGVATLIDQVKIEARGATFHVGMNYNQQQVDDIISRVKGFLKSLGGQMGSMGGGGLGGGGMQLPPPQMPQ
jgi:hypothetical protein